MERIQNYCRTYESKDFDLLDQKEQELFFSVAMEIKRRELLSSAKKKKINNLIGFRGLAYIIRNILDPPKYKFIEAVYGITEIEHYTSSKYNMDVYLFGDSHTYTYKCPGKRVEQNAALFIEQQIKTSTDFVDLYLEVPYIAKGKYKTRISSCYMADLQSKKLSPCFDWLKNGKCPYPNLRAHYVDARNNYIDPIYFSLVTIFIKAFYNNMITEGELQAVKNSKKLAAIFKTKTSLVKHVQTLISNTKIQKQLDAIKDPEIINAINIHKKDWIETSTHDTNIKFNIMTWDEILKVLNKIKSGFGPQIQRENKRLGGPLYYSIASYNGFLMDIYTVGRMFRTYEPVENKFSGRARKLIIYAGSQHTHRYEKLLKTLNFNQKSSEGGWPSNRDMCVVTESKQPFFNTKIKK